MHSVSAECVQRDEEKQRIACAGEIDGRQHSRHATNDMGEKA